MIKRYFIAVICVFITLSTQSQSLEHITDLIHNNPGEPPFKTKYNDPKFLKSEGFTAMVPYWHINCAITYDNYKWNIVPQKSETRKWIEAKARKIDIKLEACEKAGINVYPFMDFVVFPQELWDKYGESIKGNAGGHGPDIQRKMTRELVKAQIEGVFNRFPQLDGLVLRFGETYLHDTPYHRGGSPIRGREGDRGIGDHITFIELLREEICVKRNKKLFYRTWDWGYKFHENPEYYLAITNAIETHPNLMFSMKYQQGDFLRMTPFNPCIGIGKHKQVVEAQSRMEAYGKGAHPYYSAYGVLNGWPETKYEISFSKGNFTGKENAPSNPRGLKDVLSKGILCGVNTWSHGGGWQGPYINNEIWTDLNTYVVSHWAQNTRRSEEELFYEFAAKKNISGMQADIFRQIALLSIEGVRKGQCNSFTINNRWWSRDEFFSAQENKHVLQEIHKNHLQGQVLAEKAESAAIWRQIEALSKQLTMSDSKLLEAIQVSCTYGRIKYELIEQMWMMMIEDTKQKTTGVLNHKRVKSSLKRYDALWLEWRNLKKSSEECATLYTDLAFRNKKAGSIGELVEKLRETVERY